MDNVELVAQGYRYFAEGNMPAVLDLFDPEIVWDECHGFPHIAEPGIYVGPEAVVNEVFGQIPEHFEGFNIDVRELFGAEDKVVMVGYYDGKWRETGKTFHANATHVWTVKDGKATAFFQAVDTAEIIVPAG